MGRVIGGGFASGAVVSAGNAGFDPRSLTGYLSAHDLTGRFSNLWQDLARTSAATAATNPVAVADEWGGSTTRRLVNAAAATRPVIATSNTGLTFDGVDDYLLATGYAGGSQSVCYIAMRFHLPGAPPSSNGRIVSMSSAGASDFSSGFTWYLKTGNAASLDTIVPSATGSAENDLYASSTAFGTFIDAEFAITSSANSELFINGTSQGTTAKNATAMDLSRFAIGCNAFSAATFGRLCVRRVVVATSIPSTGLRSAVRAWLAL